MIEKRISHYERSKMRCKPAFKVEVKNPVRSIRVQKLDDTTNVVTTVVETKTFVRADEMKPYKVSDFCLENLQAIGAPLEPQKLTASPHTAVSMAEKVLTSMNFDNNETDNN